MSQKRVRIPSASGVALHAAALGWLLLARVALWVLPFPRAVALLERASRPGRAARTDPERVAAAVERTARRLPASTCLVQALAARAMLRRRGQAAEVRLGVSGRGRSFEAHAWLECDGRILVGAAETPGFTTLTTLP